MKKTLNIILFGRKKSYFVKCTLTLIGLYLGVLFWYFNVDYLGQPIQNALVLAVCSLICISVLVALYRIPEQLCVNSQIEKLLYFPVNIHESIVAFLQVFGRIFRRHLANLHWDVPKYLTRYYYLIFSNMVSIDQHLKRN